MENPNFLKSKYWNKEEFRDAAEKSAQKKKRQADGEFSASQKPSEKISDYIDRLKKVIENKGELFKSISLYPKYIIKEENISDEYLKNILLGNFAEMKGYDRDKLANKEIKEQILKMFEQETGQDFEGYQVPEEEKEKITEQTIKDQKISLDRWFEYLTSPESQNYPDEFKYWAFAEMLKLGSQDRDRKDFNKRTENTAAPFPELNQQALALAMDEMKRKYAKEPSRVAPEDEDKQNEFKKRLQKENFGKLYGWSLDYVNALKLPEERLPITEGEWRMFARDSSAKELADALQGYNTGWCIAGEGTAESYLGHSDVLIYFSQDQEGENTIPRAAVVTDGSRITEVRGIIQTKEVKQHLDSYITPVVEEKLNEMPGGESWQTGMEDMKKLAEIHFKHIQKEPLDKEDLVFLYELEKPIQSMGYGRDPRIEEIRKQRNPKEDAPIVFECAPEEIAWDIDEINENSKAYIGKLEVGIFSLIQKHQIEHIYTAFPEGKISRFEFEIGGMSKEEIISELEKRESLNESDKQKISISGYAKDMLKNDDFYTLKDKGKEKEKAEFIKLKVSDLGFPDGATTDKIYQKAEELGLKLCPPEIGPKLRLDYEEFFKREQSKREYFWIAMKQIADSDGVPSVFSVRRGDGGWSWLYGLDAFPEDRWNPEDSFVFRPRKFDS